MKFRIYYYEVGTHRPMPTLTTAPLAEDEARYLLDHTVHDGIYGVLRPENAVDPALEPYLVLPAPAVVRRAEELAAQGLTVAEIHAAMLRDEYDAPQKTHEEVVLERIIKLREMREVSSSWVTFQLTVPEFEVIERALRKVIAADGQ